MPLEFPCPRCQHLLRTADDKAGLSATCPACSESIWVPYPHELGAAQSKQPPHPAEPDDDPPSDRYELEDPFPEEPSSPPGETSGVAPFAAEPSYSDGAAAKKAGSEPARTDEVVTDRMRTCARCGTENEADAQQCRACAAEFPRAAPAVDFDGWQPRNPDVGEILQSAWKIYISEMGLVIGGWLLWFVMVLATVACCLIPVGLMMAIFGAADGDLVGLGVIAGILLAFPCLILGMAILNIGFVQFCINVARGTGSVGDLFYGFGEGKSLIPGACVVALPSLLANLFTCGLAAILIWPLWYAEVYRRCTAGETLSAGFGIIQREFVTVLIIGLIVYGISFAAGAIPYLGIVLLIFVTPFLEMMHAVAYLRMERERIAVDRGES